MISKIHKAGEIPAYTSEAIFADLIGRDRRGIERLRGQGVLPKKEEEGIPLKASIQAFVDYVSKTDKGRPSDRLNNAKADKVELELAIMRGKYILVDDVKEANAQIYPSIVEEVRTWEDILPQRIFPNPEDGQQEICAEIVKEAGKNLLENIAANIAEKFNV